MNFIPCRMEAGQAGLAVAFPDGPRLSLPEMGTPRYAEFAGREMIFGVRPEHLTERRSHVNPHQLDFEVVVEAREPMGNDTMVYFELGRTVACARVAPIDAAAPGERMFLTIDMDRMHLIDPATDLVIAR